MLETVVGNYRKATIIVKKGYNLFSEYEVSIINVALHCIKKVGIEH